MAINLNDPTPLYLQISDNIKLLISSKRLKEHDKLSSQKELAAQYGVSLTAVKMALAKLVQEGYLISRIGKGYYVKNGHTINIAATQTIGLALRDLDNPFFSRIVESVERHATQQGYHVFLKSNLNQAENKETQIEQFRQLGVSGLIIASVSHSYHPSPIIRKIREEKYPYVMVSYVNDPDINFVGTDHKHGGQIAAEHFIKCGYERIGYIQGEEGNLVSELRQIGFQKTLESQGIGLNRNYIYQLEAGEGWDSYNSGYEIGKEYCSRAERPEALFIYNDLSALGFQKAVLEQGLSIPGDVAIIGFDGIRRGVTANVPLTTVKQPTDQIGQLAFDNLIKLVNGEEIITRTVLKPELVIRESCGAPK